MPTAGALTDAKHYLYLFCYFLQPTPANIQSMLLYSLVHYVRDERLKKIRVPKPEQMPSVAIYHPDAPALFRTFAEYRKWYRKPLDPRIDDRSVVDAAAGDQQDDETLRRTHQRNRG